MAPIKKINAGTVSCALWENDASVNGRKVTMLKATIERRYKDNKDGQWKSSGSFGRNEIPQVVYCLLQAYATMMSEGQEEESL